MKNLSLNEIKNIAGGCTCVCKHMTYSGGETRVQPARYGDPDCSEGCTCHKHPKYVTAPTFAEYTVGPAASLMECSTVCLANGDAMKSCL